MHNRSSSTDESWDERRSMHRKHLLVLETMCCWFRRVETFLHDVAASTNALGRTRQTTTATNLWANRKWDVNYKHLHLTMSWNVLIWNRYRWALFFFWLVVLIVGCKVFGQSNDELELTYLKQISMVTFLFLASRFDSRMQGIWPIQLKWVHLLPSAFIVKRGIANLKLSI